MKQMLFGDARVSPPIVLEHTQSLGARSMAQDIRPTNNGDNGLCAGMEAARLNGDKHPEGGMAHGAFAGASNTELRIQSVAQNHNHECAVYSDGEDGGEAEAEAGNTFQHAFSAASQIRGCASDDECSTCAEDPDSP